MSKKIFPKEWREKHPYRLSDPSDLYYTKIANSVQLALDLNKFDTVLDKDMSRRVALSITSWFEDVISEIGIWRAFTTECKRRYGSYLPFYDTSEDNYFPGEINLADIQFLLWHYVQQNNLNKGLINPENQGIQLTAEVIHHLLDYEYEEAPVNQTLQDLFENFEVSSNSFFSLRSLMEWFCYDSYLNIWNEKELVKITTHFFEGRDIDEGKTNVMTYNFRVDYLLSSRNFMSLNSYQWLAMIVNDSARKELLNNISYKRYVGIYVDSADDKYVYAREVGSDGETLKITVESFNRENIKLYLGKSALTSLLYFDGAWWVSGAIIELDAYKLEDGIIKDKQEEEMKKAAYDLFVKKMKNKKVLFFENSDDYKKFFKKNFGFAIDNKNDLPTQSKDDNLFVCAHPKGGVYTQINVCSYFKHPDNPMYNPEEAKEGAHSILLNTDIPYQVSTLMIDEGLFADARMTSHQGKEHGHKLMQDNIYFLNDYYRRCCRDMDYTI